MRSLAVPTFWTAKEHIASGSSLSAVRVQRFSSRFRPEEITYELLGEDTCTLNIRNTIDLGLNANTWL
jgi:hypothetical protein